MVKSFREQKHELFLVSWILCSVIKSINASFIPHLSQSDFTSSITQQLKSLEEEYQSLLKSLEE